MKFVGYIPFGTPDITASIECIKRYCQAGCKAVEISFPVNDPIDESEMIIDFMRQALRKCADYEQYMEGVRTVRKRFPNLEINLLLFTEIIQKIGINRLVDFYDECGIYTIICPDIEHDPAMKKQCSQKGMRFAAPLHYELTADELENCLTAGGFIYMQAYPSPGQKITEGFETPDKIVKLLKEIGVKQPIYAGVGIKTLEDVKKIKEAGADAFFVGGTLMKLMHDPDRLFAAVREFIQAGK